jgi:hypothetical protein
LGRALLLALALAVLSVVVAEIAALRADEAAVVAGAHSLLGEPYGWIFFAELGLFLAAGFLLWGSAVRGGPRPRSALVASGLAAAAVFLQRYTSLLAWQTHGLLLPYPPGSYVPSWIEIAVAAGIVSLALLVLLLSLHVIPLVPAIRDERPVSAVPADRRRRCLTAVWVGLGVSLAAVGLALSLRLCTEPFLDPVLPGSPALFIGGLLVLVTAGAVYELLPEPTAAAGERAAQSPR